MFTLSFCSSNNSCLLLLCLQLIVHPGCLLEFELLDKRGLCLGEVCADRVLCVDVVAPDDLGADTEVRLQVPLVAQVQDALGLQGGVGLRIES